MTKIVRRMIPLERRSFFRDNSKTRRNIFHIEMVQQYGKTQCKEFEKTVELKDRKRT